MAKLVARDPFAEFDGLFGSAFDRPFGGRGGRHGAAAQMPVNIYETEAGIAIEAALPGFGGEDIDVTYEDGRLTIRAEHDAESCEDAAHDHEGRRYRHREVFRRRLERSFTLGKQFDGEQISAELQNGMLRLQLVRTPEAEARRIPISVN